MQFGDDFPGYRIKGPLGAGFGGTVLRAESLRLGRDVALKVFHQVGLGSEVHRKRFQREAEIFVAHPHPALLPLLDADLERDPPYMVFALMEGGSLQDHLEPGDMLPFALVLEMGSRIAEALEALHRQGIVHRDVKPGNVLLNENKEAFLADLGLGLMPDVSRLTQEGWVVGTPAYLAPEILNGHPSTPASDLFALGVTLLEALVGQIPPPETPDPGHFEEYLDRIRPEALARLLRRCLRQDPEDRPQDLGQLARDLHKIQARSGGEFEARERPWEFTREPSLVLESEPLDEVLAGVVPDARPGASLGWLGPLLLGLGLAAALGLVWFRFLRSPQEAIPTQVLALGAGPSRDLIDSVSILRIPRPGFGSLRVGAEGLWIEPALGGESLRVPAEGPGIRLLAYAAEEDFLVTVSRRRLLVESEARGASRDEIVLSASLWEKDQVRPLWSFVWPGLEQEEVRFQGLAVDAEGVLAGFHSSQRGGLVRYWDRSGQPRAELRPGLQPWALDQAVFWVRGKEEVPDGPPREVFLEVARADGRALRRWVLPDPE